MHRPRVHTHPATITRMSLSFDPREAVLVPQALALPAVDALHLSAAALRARFLNPPIWEAESEVERWLKAAEPTPASVLVPVIVRPWLPGEPSVLLTLRAKHLKAHAGQVSFPGGRQEPQDGHARVTALREAYEEVGLPPERVEVIGELPPYVTGTGFVVTPVVGLILAEAHETHSLDLRPDPGEVAAVFEVPLSYLMDPANHQLRTVSIGEADLSFFAMPWRHAAREEDYFIWGATAAMLRNLYRFLSA